MKIALFSAKPYDIASFTAANGSFDHELAFFEDRMRGRAAPLAEGFPAADAGLQHLGVEYCDLETVH